MSPLVTETRAALARLTSVDDMRALITGMAETISHADALDWKNFSDSIVRSNAKVTGDSPALSAKRPVD